MFNFASISGLTVAWLAGVIKEETARLEQEQPLFFADRVVRSVEATPDDVFLTDSGRVVLSDLIQLDQAAAIHRPKLELSTTQTGIPKIKHGVMFDERLMDLLNRLSMSPSPASRDMFSLESQLVMNIGKILQGIRERRELLISQMFQDSSSYDRFGVKLSGFSWGAPALYKPAVPATPWNNVAATPIANIRAHQRQVLDDGGAMYDVIVMTQQIRDNIVATTEFQSQAPAFVPTGTLIPVSNLPFNNPAYANDVLSRMLGMQVIVLDSPLPGSEKFKLGSFQEAEDGSQAFVRFWPQDTILLMDSMDIGNRMAWDFANVELVETYNGGMVPNMIGGFSGVQSGPVAYVEKLDGNPPGLVLWGAQRGFPRLHQKKRKTVWKVY
jgi:hypothetical protein